MARSVVWSLRTPAVLYSDMICFSDIFDDDRSSLSRLFREIRVEHHLIQDDLKQRPDIPGLTPKGFEAWATLLILANPEREYQRLQKAVRNMPINNPDDKTERFPKEIPRRLFPDLPDIKIREDLENRMMVHCGVDMPYITDEERKQATRPSRSPTSTASSTERTHSYERGRPRPVQPPSPSARTKPRPVSMTTDDEDETISSVPIERERKPYSAHPGGGKVYGEPGPSHSHASSASSRASESSYKDKTSAPAPRMSESYGRDPHHLRTGSGASLDQRFQPEFRSASRNMNHSGDYRRSENDILGRDHTPRYAGLSAHDLHYTESPTSSRPDDEPRYHRSSHEGRENDYYRGGGSGHGFDKYYR